VSALKYWLWLSTRHSVNSAAIQRLLDRFGDAKDVYFAARPEYRDVEGVSSAALESLAEKSLDEAERILENCAENDIRILPIRDAEYPERLRNIFDPPVVLYVKGTLPPVDELPAVAVVGKRKCTPYGRLAAEKLAAQITEHGGLVVSGMAEGIDAAGHRGALKAGGKTVAVLGSGVDIVYPSFHEQLYHDIIASGAVVSELPPGTQPSRFSFPRRNRIISGLSVAVLVAEADLSSGSLITANHALEQGREVFAVPGNIGVSSSEGCLKLIREGAGIAASGWDILQEFVPVFGDRIVPRPRRRGGLPSERIGADVPAQTPERGEAVRLPDTAGLSEEEKQIVLLLKDGPLHVDELIARTGLPAATVLADLTVLEIGGAVEQLEGKTFRLKPEETISEA